MCGGLGLDRLRSIELDFWRLAADQHYIISCHLSLSHKLLCLLVSRH
jgi:hypothetical protein